MNLALSEIEATSFRNSSNTTCLDGAVELCLEGGEDVYVVLEVALVHRLLRPPHRHEQRTPDQRVLLSLPLAGLPPGEK